MEGGQTKMNNLLQKKIKKNSPYYCIKCGLRLVHTKPITKSHFVCGNCWISFTRLQNNVWIIGRSISKYEEKFVF